MATLTREDIKKTLEEKVDPQLKHHYGGAILSDFQDGIVTVKMTGSCATCPSAQDTINSVVKEILCGAHEEIKDVIMDTTVSEDLLDLAKNILNKTVKIEK